MKIPSKEELIVTKGIDEPYILKHFLGKDLSQAETMFKNGMALYGEDLAYMGPIGFCFYIKAVKAYSLSSESEGDWDLIVFLINSLTYQCDQNIDEISSALPDIEDIVDHVLDNWEKFLPDEDDKQIKVLWHILKTKLET